VHVAEANRAARIRKGLLARWHGTLHRLHNALVPLRHTQLIVRPKRSKRCKRSLAKAEPAHKHAKRRAGRARAQPPCEGPERVFRPQRNVGKQHHLVAEQIDTLAHLPQDKLRTQFLVGCQNRSCHIARRLA
jgi:hypothetical protein